MTRPVSRLAPTPSGLLHLGNLMNFTITWAMVRRQHGQLWLRIDDVDVQRSRPEYAQDIRDTLGWLGLNWDGVLPSQAQRTSHYRQWLEQLPTYACDCSRKTLLARHPAGDYDGHCRNRGLKFVEGVTQLRLRSTVPSHDVVLWRKENLPAYQLASVVDDLEAQVTLIVRGEDLRESSRVQIEVADLLGPSGRAFSRIRFLHHPLLLAKSGTKLSKSNGDESLQAMRRAGAGPADIFQLLGEQMGLAGQFRSAADFIKVDWDKMDWAGMPSPSKS